MNQQTPIERAAQIVGGLTKLADIAGVSVPTAHEWKTQKRPVPIARCVAVSNATHGQVTLKELRPNDWQQIWPELDSQPNPQQQQAAA